MYFKIFVICVVSIINLNGLEILKNKKFTVLSQSNTYTTNFFLNIKHKEYSKIETIILEAIKYSDESKICKGGKYRIYPSYKFISNKRTADGYKSNINFNCTFKEKKEYESLLDNIKSLPYIELTQNSIKKTLSDKTLETATIKLESKAYQYALEYQSFLNKKFSNCLVKQIDFTNGYPNIVPMQRSTTQVGLPLDQKLESTISVKYKFNCN